ncbi:MAG TPA: 3-deoxy-manno-octulosonate cytidylyltransferase [Vicinamibacterales bacterium]|nr:3-deoxy-manno-octulosonate cytidylyltransferase [Vicinamibacterales bacterium]
MPAVPVTRLPFALTETSVLAIIPARYHSTRLPAKALADIAGRPMIEHVYRRASRAASIDAVVIATDDERIARAADSFGAVAVMTAAGHTSGTDRLAEIAASIPCGLIVNVQGDEPLLDPAVIDAVVEPMRRDPSIQMGTAARRLRSADELTNHDVVKVVCDVRGFALYFSRAPIPSGRALSAFDAARVHIGLYVYRRATLLQLAALPPGTLERLEALEQLRALEHGVRIHVVETPFGSAEVNTPEDLERVRQLFATAPHDG